MIRDRCFLAVFSSRISTPALSSICVISCSSGRGCLARSKEQSRTAAGYQRENELLSVLLFEMSEAHLRRHHTLAVKNRMGGLKDFDLVRDFRL